MAELSRADVELVYKYLDSDVRNDIEAEAYDAALDDFENVNQLDAANDDPESSFAWHEITFEFHRGELDRDELVPLTGIEPNEEPEIYDVAHDFGWLVVENIRNEIRTLQERTMLSPKEFVTLVLDSEWDENSAASLMGITVGNYRGKKGKIAAKLETAEETLDLAEQLQNT